MKIRAIVLCIVLCIFMLVPVFAEPDYGEFEMHISVDKNPVPAGDTVTITVQTTGSVIPDNYVFQLWIVEGEQASQITETSTSEPTFSFPVLFGDRLDISVLARYRGTILIMEEIYVPITGSTPNPMTVEAVVDSVLTSGKEYTFKIHASGGVPPYKYRHRVGISGPDFWQDLYSADLPDGKGSFVLTIPYYGTGGLWVSGVQDSKGRLVDCDSKEFIITGHSDKGMETFLRLFTKYLGDNKYELTAEGHAPGSDPFVHYTYYWRTWNDETDVEYFTEEGDNLTQSVIVCEGKQHAHVALVAKDDCGRISDVCTAEAHLPSGGISLEIHRIKDIWRELIQPFGTDLEDIAGRLITKKLNPIPEPPEPIRRWVELLGKKGLDKLAEDIKKNILITDVVQEGNTLIPVINESIFRNLKNKEKLLSPNLLQTVPNVVAPAMNPSQNQAVPNTNQNFLSPGLQLNVPSTNQNINILNTNPFKKP